MKKTQFFLAFLIAACLLLPAFADAGTYYIRKKPEQPQTVPQNARMPQVIPPGTETGLPPCREEDEKTLIDIQEKFAELIEKIKKTQSTESMTRFLSSSANIALMSDIYSRCYKQVIAMKDGKKP